MRFADRTDAGRRLAARLQGLAGRDDLVVVGLPRGGVPVAAEVARALRAPLDVIVVRKLGVPSRPELAMGAVGEGGVLVLEDDVLRRSGVSQAQLAAVERRERDEVERRARRFRGDRPMRSLAGRTVVVVDDGVATGSTARAACLIARAAGADRVVLAVPVGPRDAASRLGGAVDELVCLTSPMFFAAVGQVYDDFSQTTDAQVADALTQAAVDGPGRDTAPAADPQDTRDPDEAGSERTLPVRVGDLELVGDLVMPPGCRGVVVFAHGSGSSRRSPRNRYVAGKLQGAGLGTLLLDLLSEEEERHRANVFDVPLLAGRLTAATRWLRTRPGLGTARVGYFGASTGAAAALWAAAEPDAGVAAVVSRGGRPDLADVRLPDVDAPTLLVVGGRDDVVLDLNRRAQALLRCESELVVVPGATHLFPEPGALQVVAMLAARWFVRHLDPGSAAPDGAPAGGRPPTP